MRNILFILQSAILVKADLFYTLLKFESFLQKLTDIWMVMPSPAFYGNSMIRLIVDNSQPLVPIVSYNKNVPTCSLTFSIQFRIIYLKSGITFPTKTLFSFLISSMRITRTAYFIPVDLLTTIVNCKNYVVPHCVIVSSPVLLPSTYVQILSSAVCY
jgi:hypothetical protein